MAFQEQMVLLRDAINQEMQQYINEQKKRLAPDDVFLREALQKVEAVIFSGGKRLRGALLVQGYLAAGGQDQTSVLRAAAGLEFLHSYILMHDDIMDRDEMRHGTPTLHQSYQKIAEQLFLDQDSVHFGNSVALVLGDMVSAWGNDLVFSVDLPRENVQAAIRFLQQVVFATGAGQIEDMRIQYQKNATEEEVLALYQRKTAEYTIVGPLTLGALLAGDKTSFQEFFADYGRALGIAFQITDDLLGLYASPEKTGKKLASDIIEGKMTYLMVALLNHTEGKTQKRVRTILSHKEPVTDDDILFIQESFATSGAQRYVEEALAIYSKEAQTILEREKDRLPAAPYLFLEGLTAYITTREQ
jgi:geranylgeranyl diphosphate synthase type I